MNLPSYQDGYMQKHAVRVGTVKAVTRGGINGAYNKLKSNPLSLNPISIWRNLTGENARSAALERVTLLAQLSNRPFEQRVLDRKLGNARIKAGGKDPIRELLASRRQAYKQAYKDARGSTIAARLALGLGLSVPVVSQTYKAFRGPDEESVE